MCMCVCVCVCVCVSTQVPAFLNGLRLGFSEFEVMNVFDECMCGENSLNISIYFFFITEVFFRGFWGKNVISVYISTVFN